MSAAQKPLYQQEIHIPSWKPAPLTLTCQLVGGKDAIPQNHKGKHMGLRHNDRISKRTKLRHRGNTEISLTSGNVRSARAGVNQHRTYSSAEKRLLAVAVLRDRGEAISEGAITGILSGRTL